MLNDCFDKARKEKLPKSHLQKHHAIVERYIANIIELKWNDGKIEVIENEDPSKKSGKKRK